MTPTLRRAISADRPPVPSRDTRSAAGLLLTLALALAVPGRTAAQEPRQPEEFIPRALVTGALEVEPDDSPRANGYRLLHARLGASGRVGLGVEYLVIGGTTPRQEGPVLLDARLAVPVGSDLRLTLGQFKAPFSGEALRNPDQLQFARPAQGASALAPFRQVGVQVSGEILAERLSYRVGMFNGEGRSSDNPDGDFLYVGRVDVRREPGPGRYFDELNVTLGANAAVSSDSARDVSDAGPFRTPEIDPRDFRGRRLMWGGDLRIAYRRFFVDAEFLETRFEPAASEPTGPDLETQVARGVYAEAGSFLLPGVLDLLVRWDGFDPPAASRRDFLVFGANLYPGYNTRLGFQYSRRLDDAGGADRPPGEFPGRLADGQFVVRLEASL